MNGKRISYLHLPVSFLNLIPGIHLFNDDFKTPVFELGQSMVDHLIAQAALVSFVASTQTAPFVSDSFSNEESEIRVEILELRTTQCGQIDNASVAGDCVQVLRKGIWAVILQTINYN